MSEMHDRLRQARINAGFDTAREAARAFGFSYSTYASHENGQRGIRLEHAGRYARAFRVDPSWLITGIPEQGGANSSIPLQTVPVVGKAAAGVWLEFEEGIFDDHLIVPRLPSSGFPLAHQIAYQVEGPSMNKVLPDGCFAVGMTVESSRHPRHGDIVAVHRMRGGLMERTIKRYSTDAGYPQLVPESTDPRFQTPIVLESHEEDTLVVIVAIIIGLYQPV